MTDGRWAQRLHQHLVADAELGDGPYWAEPGGGIEPAARWAWEDLADRGLLHRHVDHVRSSQAFALNLFAPLDTDAMVRLLRRFSFDVVEADPPRFEWEDRHDRLHEATKVRPHRTQVDVVLRGRTALGRTVTVLVEVKLSETDLNPCSAYESPYNDTRDNCRQAGMFGGDPQVCFQLRNRDLGPRRSYDTTLKWEPTQPAGAAGCAVRGGANQAMRNLALANLTAADSGEASSDSPQVFFVLCAPLAHQAIWRRWAEIRTLFPGPRVVSLPADEVVAHHTPARRDRLAARYLLQPDVVTPPDLDEIPEAKWDNEWPEDAWRELASWHVATALVERHPELRVIETHPGGGQYDCLSLYPPPAQVGSVDPIQLNRMGSIHLRVAEPPSAIREAWERLALQPDTGALVVEIEARAGLPHTHPAQPHPAYRLITAVLTHAHRTGTPWLCRNGYLDTSGYGAGVWAELFDQIPGSTAVLDDTRRDDFEGGPAYRCWFLGPADRDRFEPQVMIEVNGTLIRANGSIGTLVPDFDVADLARSIVEPGLDGAPSTRQA